MEDYQLGCEDVGLGVYHCLIIRVPDNSLS